MKLRGIFEDVRYALRLLRKAPGFTVVAVLTLALGIGANTAIYTLLDKAVLRTLPVQEPNRLVILKYSGSFSGYSRTRTDDHFYFSYPMYRDLRDHNSVFTGLLATTSAEVGVQWHNEPELADAELVSGNYFDVLRVQPALGRLFVPAEDVAQEANPVVVLSFSYWQRRFGSDPHILYQSLSINGHPFTVIGVAAPGFHSIVSGDSPVIFVPMMMKPQITPGWNDLEERKSQWLNIVGRLKPGLSAQQAQSGIDPLWHSIREEELKQRAHSSERFKAEFLTKSHLFLERGSKGVPVQGSPTTLLVVMGMAGLMILMACANVASLLLVRATTRIREIGVRYALGARRGRILQQLLAEGLLLGFLGGTLGVLLAPRVSALLLRTLLERTADQAAFRTHVDFRILVFNFLLTLLVSLLFSLAPAIQFWRPDLTPSLKQQTVTTGSSPIRLRRALVSVQIGLSLLLLVGAGLFVRTLHNLESLDVGFKTENLVEFSIDPRLAGYAPAQTPDLYKRLLDTVAALPGVHFAAATSDAELANTNTGSNITVVGYHPTEQEDMNVEWERVSPGYTSTLQMPLLAGRDITDQDRTGTQKVAVVNERFARQYFGEPANAIGHYFGKGAGDIKTDIQIVGVVKDARHTGVREEIRRSVFTPYLQEEQAGMNASGMTFYVRTWQAPENAESTIRQSLHTFDSKLVPNNLRTMKQQINDNLGDERIIAFLASCFGMLASLIAGIGIYGVLAYSIAQRTREIGVRITVGATRATVARLVFAEVLWMAAAGIACGLPASFGLAQLVRSQVFGISTHDPLTLAVVCAAILCLALAAAAVPAWRAAKVDPIVALRYE
jgi:putative ABC transport system permease protein